MHESRSASPANNDSVSSGDAKPVDAMARTQSSSTCRGFDSSSNRVKPASVSVASFPSMRTYPLGTTVRYSYQKSKRSPTIKISAA